ncbi:hypothetical protein [Actinokineospora pegani]|uniref:hypothetical protein n=1 Tax=Actinokineospora pegani TaxID=2654637 RepID=UPI0012EA9EA0|nr:hypothetical protein [Actinokineospora pegani]
MGSGARRAGDTVRQVWSLWYVVVPLFSLGLLAFAPFVHAAVRLRRPRLLGWVAAFMGTSGLAFYMGGVPEGSVNPVLDAGAVVMVFGGAVVATVLAGGLRREVYALPPMPVAPQAPALPGQWPLDPAVAGVLRARARRAEARQLAAGDPLMARELGIGRPDVTREYDDGGLVDLASAPAHTIAEVLDLTAEQAEGIIAVRAAAMTVDDVFSLTDLPVDTWDRIRDRSIVIR